MDARCAASAVGGGAVRLPSGSRMADGGYGGIAPEPARLRSRIHDPGQDDQGASPVAIGRARSPGRGRWLFRVFPEVRGRRRRLSVRGIHARWRDRRPDDLQDPDPSLHARRCPGVGRVAGRCAEGLRPLSDPRSADSWRLPELGIELARRVRSERHPQASARGHRPAIDGRSRTRACGRSGPANAGHCRGVSDPAQVRFAARASLGLPLPPAPLRCAGGTAHASLRSPYPTWSRSASMDSIP